MSFPGLKTKRLEVVCPGCSVGPDVPMVGAGTLSAIVTRRGEDPARKYLLSNNHVLAGENTVPKGTMIVQPAASDGGSAAIAKLTDFVPLNLAGSNEVDGAIAEVLVATRVTPALPGTLKLRSPEPIQPVNGRKVGFVGRTSGERRAVIETARAEHDVELWFELSRGIQFRNLMSLRTVDDEPLADGGDSGSLVIDLDSGRPVGLLIVAVYRTALAIPIGPVLEQLQIDLEVQA